jgi:hypothetical protein
MTARRRRATPVRPPARRPGRCPRSGRACPWCVPSRSRGAPPRRRPGSTWPAPRPTVSRRRTSISAGERVGVGSGSREQLAGRLQSGRGPQQMLGVQVSAAVLSDVSRRRAKQLPCWPAHEPGDVEALDRPARSTAAVDAGEELIERAAYQGIAEMPEVRPARLVSPAAKPGRRRPPARGGSPGRAWRSGSRCEFRRSSARSPGAPLSRHWTGRRRQAGRHPSRGW